MSNDKIINKRDLLNDLPSAVTIYNTVYNLQEIEKKNLLAYNEKQCFKKSDLNKAFFYSTYVNNNNRLLREKDFFHIYGDINDFLHSSLEFKFKTSYIASTLPKSINLSIGIHANKDNVIQITESKEKESFNIFYLFTKGSIEDDNLIQKLYGIKLNYKESIEDADGNIYYHYTLSGVTESGVTESEITDDLEFYGYDDYNNLIKIYPEYPLEITDSPLLESIEQTEIGFDNNQPGIRDISSSNLATIWTEDYIRDIHKDDGFDDYNLQIANYFTLYYDKPIYDYDRLDFSKNILLYEVKEEDVTNWEKGEYSFPNKSIITDESLSGALLYLLYYEKDDSASALKFIIKGIKTLEQTNYYYLENVSFSEEQLDDIILNDIGPMTWTSDFLLIKKEDIIINNGNIDFINPTNVELFVESNSSVYTFNYDNAIITFSNYVHNKSSLYINVYQPEWLYGYNGTYDLILTVRDSEVNRGFRLSTNNPLTISFNNTINDDGKWFHKKRVFLPKNANSVDHTSAITIKNFPINDMPLEFFITLENISIENTLDSGYDIEIDYDSIQYDSDNN